uniref:Peptidase S1 domain-containing protein n=1 Tax=Latimeria chalumnae TaxID=7897 RepID=H3A1X5_LATCH
KVFSNVSLFSAFGCGVSSYPPNTNRVVNGVEARPNSWPWQISLQMYTGSYYGHVCGGTLIGTNWVMTAAHCIFGGRYYRIVAGEHDLSKIDAGEQAISVNGYFIHPSWNGNCVGCGYDIALLRLSSHVSLTDKVQLGCMPSPNTILPNNYSCYITGWGMLYTNGPTPNTLQQALLPVVAQDVCSRYDYWGQYAKNTMVCAGGGRTSGCQGDSGGPLHCRGSDGRWYVHGITSFVSGSACNEAKKPTVFTRVSAYSSWIQNVREHK